MFAKNPLSKDKICLICGDGAIGKNFGSVSCESCKAFFRRNAAKREEYVCLYIKKCKIGLNTRKFCRTCRLEKCFDVGMKEDWILNDEQREERRLKIEAKRLKRNKNADKCEDKLETKHMSNESADENNNLKIDVLNTEINDWTTGPQSMDHEVLATDTSNSIDSLGSGYESALIPVVRPVLVINNNFNASEHQFFSELLSAISQLHLNVDPVAIHELKTFEEYRHSMLPKMESDFKVMVNVCKSLHTFRSVCDSDRMALFKPGTREALMLHAFGHFYDHGNQCWNINMDDGTVYVLKLDVLKQMPGNTYSVAKRLLYNIAHIMDSDHYIIQLLIPILLFNPERPNLTHKDLVKLQQRLYMYLLKRYLTIKYGSETEANTRFKQILDTLHDLSTLCEIQLQIERSLDPREVGPLMREVMDIPSNDNYIYTIL